MKCMFAGQTSKFLSPEMYINLHTFENIDSLTYRCFVVAKCNDSGMELQRRLSHISVMDC